MFFGWASNLLSNWSVVHGEETETFELDNESYSYGLDDAHLILIQTQKINSLHCTHSCWQFLPIDQQSLQGWLPAYRCCSSVYSGQAWRVRTTSFKGVCQKHQITLHGWGDQIYGMPYSQGKTYLIQTLKYNLNPPTINMWANKLMQQWDLFMESNPFPLQDYFTSHTQQYFKKIDDLSYQNYRTVMQILDCAILDIQTVQYKPKILVCSIIYLVLGNSIITQAKSWVNSTRQRLPMNFPEHRSFS